MREALTAEEREAAGFLARWLDYGPAAERGGTTAHGAVRTVLAALDRLAAQPATPATDDAAFLAAVEARLQAATPGPWGVADASPNDGRYVVADDGGDDPLAVTEIFSQPDALRDANAALVANAPADLARLVALVRELEGALYDRCLEEANATEYRRWVVGWLRERSVEQGRLADGASHEWAQAQYVDARNALAAAADALAEDAHRHPPLPPWQLREECGRYRAALEAIAPVGGLASRIAREALG